MSERLSEMKFDIGVINALKNMVRILVHDEDSYNAWKRDRGAFVNELCRGTEVEGLFSSEEDFEEIMQLVEKIRKAVQSGTLDADFIGLFDEVRGVKPNYQKYTATKWNFDKSTEKKTLYKQAIDTKPGYKAMTDRRLKYTQTSGFEKAGKGLLDYVVADEIFGPLLSEKIINRIVSMDAE